MTFEKAIRQVAGASQRHRRAHATSWPSRGDALARVDALDTHHRGRKAPTRVLDWERAAMLLDRQRRKGDASHRG